MFSIINRLESCTSSWKGQNTNLTNVWVLLTHSPHPNTDINFEIYTLHHYPERMKKGGKMSKMKSQ